MNRGARSRGQGLAVQKKLARISDGYEDRPRRRAGLEVSGKSKGLRASQGILLKGSLPHALYENAQVVPLLWRTCPLIALMREQFG